MLAGKETSLKLTWPSSSKVQYFTSLEGKNTENKDNKSQLKLDRSDYSTMATTTTTTTIISNERPAASQHEKKSIILVNLGFNLY